MAGSAVVCVWSTIICCCDWAWKMALCKNNSHFISGFTHLQSLTLHSWSDILQRVDMQSIGECSLQFYQSISIRACKCVNALTWFMFTRPVICIFCINATVCTHSFIHSESRCSLFCRRSERRWRMDAIIISPLCSMDIWSEKWLCTFALNWRGRSFTCILHVRLQCGWSNNEERK